MENNCPHYDYGKTAPIEYGAYCWKKEKFVEDCEGCEEKVTIIEQWTKNPDGTLNKLVFLGRCEEGEEE